MPRRRGDHPNVVVFFTDQQRWDTAGMHGNPLDLMPNFDRVAQWRTHAYYHCACQPVGAPARAALQTGQYQNVTGCFSNRVPLPDGIPTLARYFRDGGGRLRQLTSVIDRPPTLLQAAGLAGRPLHPG